MHLISKNNLSYELRPENLEDLWILSQFISKDDIIYSTTERKVKVGSENNPKQVKKLIHVNLKVNKSQFESDILRVSGEIQNETEFTSVGSSHTLNFNVNDVIKLDKKEILKYQENLLNNSLKTKKNLRLLVLLDKDDMIVFEYGDYSYKALFTKSGLGSKKYIEENLNDYEEKYLILEPFIKRDYSSFIFAGPGHFKDELSKYVKDKIGLNPITYQFQEVSEKSIQKLIDEINSKGLVSESQLSIENSKVNRVLESINRNLKVSYGIEETFSSIDDGRVETLLISTKLIDRFKEDDNYDNLNEKIKLVESMNGDLVIVQSNNEPGKILDGLGGISALLRY